MKLINALIFPVAFSKRTPKFQTPDEAFEDFTQKAQKLLENEPLDELEDPFKSALDYPTHNPADFEGENLNNLSDNLSNARNVLMKNPETGEEDSDNKCGWNGCEGKYSHYYDASYAINGKPMRGEELPDYRETGFDVFASFSGYRRNTAFVADIANNPTVDFVKVWPPINGQYEYIEYAHFNKMRVFVNDVECFMIDRYSTKKVKDMVKDSNGYYGYDYTAMIYKCEEPVKNAYTIRAHKANAGWLTFKEIEIYGPNKPNRVVEIPVDQAGSLSAIAVMNNKIAVKDIVNHGCHCSKYSNSEFVGGYAVDEMDSMCQEWNSKLKCLTLPEGACENGIDFDFFNIQINDDGTPSDDLDFACATTQNDCEAAVCRVTYDWGMKLWQSTEENGPGSRRFNYKPDSMCYPQPPNGDSHICVGEAPDVVIMKN